MHKFYFQLLEINNYDMKLIYSMLLVACYCTVRPAVSLIDSTNNIQCDYSKYSINNRPCEEMLTCDSMRILRIQHELQSEGFVKKRFLATYKDIQVVYSYPRNDHVSGDFLHGINMLLAFQTNSLVAKVIGYCKDVNHLQLVTLYYEHGSLNNINDVLKQLKLKSLEEFTTRTQLAYDYISIISYLHDSTTGVRVMCDTNTLIKTLQQFLITTDLRLVVLDLDALPMVTPNLTIKCGHKQLFGDFVAPEQLWYDDIFPFDEYELKGYDEKTDVWKIPDVIIYLLGKSSYSIQLQFYLFDLLQQCKEIDSKLRPTAVDVKIQFKKYVKVIIKDEL